MFAAVHLQIFIHYMKVLLRCVLYTKLYMFISNGLQVSAIRLKLPWLLARSPCSYFQLYGNTTERNMIILQDIFPYIIPKHYSKRGWCCFNLLFSVIWKYDRTKYGNIAGHISLYNSKTLQ